MSLNDTYEVYIYVDICARGAGATPLSFFPSQWRKVFFLLSFAIAYLALIFPRWKTDSHPLLSLFISSLPGRSHPSNDEYACTVRKTTAKS